MQKVKNKLSIKILLFNLLKKLIRNKKYLKTSLRNIVIFKTN